MDVDAESPPGSRALESGARETRAPTRGNLATLRNAWTTAGSASPLGIDLELRHHPRSSARYQGEHRIRRRRPVGDSINKDEFKRQYEVRPRDGSSY